MVLTEYASTAQIIETTILGLAVDPSYSWNKTDRWSLSRDQDFESAEGLHLRFHAHILRSERESRDVRRVTWRIVYLYRYAPGEHTGPAGAIDSESASYCAGHALELALSSVLPISDSSISVERIRTDTHLIGHLDFTLYL